ncbi:MAG: decaprenyl-phosphate phosphoribosyltransferase [Phycisphaerae bacterium]|nr:decaprenyl-phosphate phosphoribosyltransferase [Phycisphaerae bacterium]
MERDAKRAKGGPAALVEAMRIPHWTKNIFVLAALPFGGKWAEPSAWAMAIGALATFCLLSSAIYLINDIADRKSDRAHPVKKDRPVASGRLSPVSAAVAAAMLLTCGAGLVAYLSCKLYRTEMPLAGMGLAVWAGAYVLINLAYNLGLKGRPILDVIIVAMGFVLRAMAGAAAIAVVISPWMVVCTFMLCLFIALAKRRSEIIALGDSAGDTRRVHGFYTLVNLDHMLSVSAGLAILTYSLYCLAPRTVEHVGSAHLIWTIPLVVYGMFRYYCLTLTADGDDPVWVLLRDKVLWMVGAVWIGCVIVVLRWGASDAIRGLLQ